MRVMPIEQIARKWKRRAGAAVGDFEQGVRNPRRPWQEATLAAASAYADGVQAAIANDQFSKGVSATSNSDWLERATTLGPARYGQGVAASDIRYRNKFRPFRDAIAAIELPPRGPRGSTQNYDRVRLIGETLHNLRVGGA